MIDRLPNRDAQIQQILLEDFQVREIGDFAVSGDELASGIDSRDNRIDSLGPLGGRGAVRAVDHRDDFIEEQVTHVNDLALREIDD